MENCNYELEFKNEELIVNGKVFKNVSEEQRDELEFLSLLSQNPNIEIDVPTFVVADEFARAIKQVIKDNPQEEVC